MVSAISERLSRLNPTKPPAVPSSASGTVTLGITVAGTLRRKTKITVTTSPMDSISVNSTSCTDARIVCVRSTRMLTSTVGGIAAFSWGSAALIASTVSITLAPGCLVITSTMPRPAAIPLSGSAAPG
jgi:hypothetical protein